MNGNPFSGGLRMNGRVFESGGAWFVLAIIASHLFSFLWNFLGKGEFRRASPRQVMAAPYGRLVVLHFALLLGAFATAALGSPVYLLILLIIGKIALDVKLHLRSHAKLNPAAA